MVRLNPEVEKKFKAGLLQKAKKEHKEQGTVGTTGTKRTAETSGTERTKQVRWRIPIGLVKEIKLKAVKEEGSLQDTVKEVISKGLK